MLSEYISVGIDDVSRALLDLLFEEFFHRDLADETESLTIFAVGIGETSFFGDCPDFGFVEVSDREEGVCKLKLRET